jgi:hypothetical protein
MIANSKDPGEFTFFPFTSPNPKRNRRRYNSNTDSKDLTKSKEFHLGQIQQSDCSTHATTGTKGTEVSSTMSGFDTGSAFDIPNHQTMPGQKSLFADFDDAGVSDKFLKDEKAWVTFGTSNDATSDPENSDLSPMSTKVQVGQADAYEIADIDKEGDYNDDTVTSTTEYDDDVDYGPAPLPNVNFEGASQSSCIESNDDKSERSIAATTTTKSHILMLVTNMGMNRTQVQNQQRATMMLNALNITYETVDGSDPSNKEIRNELFTISDIRGAYPQFFVVTDHGDNSELQISFLGDFETIEGINDSSSLPNEILDANPTLLTWSRIPYLSYQN